MYRLDSDFQTTPRRKWGWAGAIRSSLKTGLLGVGLVVAAVTVGRWVGSGQSAPGTAKPGSETNRLPPLPVVAKPIPQQPPTGVAEDRHLDKNPPRETRGLDLVRLGWSYNCMECHRLFPARWHYDRPMNEHQDIRLEHGNNRFCLNCHHPTDRNAFVDYDGSAIAEADVVLLCAKCHGPTYRDWKAGVHGRRNGFWDRQKGTQTQLRCIQCHDPHHPKFQPMPPLPPPTYPPRAAQPPSESRTTAPGVTP
ncbi:MAG: hypothetical protein JNL10_01295 [Verrucomicrobiales bacterium]|nr:hypothetical protein [Verrucomicrobiales bacterium]